MITGIGIDTVAIARIEALWRRGGERFLRRVYTTDEVRYCLARARPGESLAARFAAKEAVMKCLGTGWSQGVGFLQIEVLPLPTGPAVRLHGRAAEVARLRGIRSVHLSMTHGDRDAVACAIAEN